MGFVNEESAGISGDQKKGMVFNPVTEKKEAHPRQYLLEKGLWKW